MNSTEYILAVKCDTVFRDSGWLDVARFFVLNYGLHVFTVRLPPGASIRNTALSYIGSLVIPIYGVGTACGLILNCVWRGRGQLHTALEAGALCMVVPLEYKNEDPDLTRKTIIHGQFPATVWAETIDAESEASVNRWCLRIVPKSFTVLPLIGLSGVPLQLSYNYSFVGTAAGIIQVLSGSMQIYHASSREIPNLGYAAYSLTVVPYLFMSIVNLVGAMCEPRYPSMFLVRYCGPKAPEPSSDNGEIRLLPPNEAGTEQTSESELWTEPELSGTVGQAYGNLSETIDESNRYLVWQYSIILVLAIVPFVIIGALTGFRSANSTLAQRIWIMLWLVAGQACMILAFWVADLRNGLAVSRAGPTLEAFGLAGTVVGLCVVVVTAIGGYVVVVQMILQDKVCFRA